MDVGGAEFRSSLLRILRDISEATIVTFDLEMSGITTKPKCSAGDQSLNVGKPTLQNQYEEMKSAAETYQVLQLGITCVSEDVDKEYYLAKPYNFTISPLQADGTGMGHSALRLNRNFTFSSSASEFLAKNGFDFGKVFTAGVPYLSRDEEIELLEEYKQREGRKANIPDLVIGASDYMNLEFVRSARKTVTVWFENPEHKDDFVNVSHPAGPLTGLQRRLVHQFIRSEFPTLRAFGLMDGSFMQVRRIDLIQEQAYQARQAVTYKGNIAKQTGLRWIFEALCGGNLSGVDVKWFINELEVKEAKTVKEELEMIIKDLKSKKRMIVGHNLFFDLGFLYKTFIGILPNNVKDFQEDINDLFPFIIDTKYLATQSPGTQNPRSGLKELLAPFRKIHVPLIVLHEDHVQYGAEYGRDHEAGYDSWMTAELFVKLAGQLSSESKDILDDESGSSGSDEFFSAPEEYLKEHRDSEGGAGLKSGPDLIDFGEDVDAEEVKTEQWLPRMSSKFWKKYVNKLRVNSSEGGVCDLAERGEDRGVGGVRRKLAQL
ncbi:CAF1-domain-containing protein [Mollisia scopiformis]|uniref:CAF1-domain-containing protein n=1 Tax=Mollisia scopiformis TaxID=149040 RepID=A0A194XIG2_MOLSC|nr:CAF1-domain-containing protein [Mollisia scopiformis]KUJ19557.1 CAF1-domain-containing protein [Mollisia scopiformis]